MLFILLIISVGLSIYWNKNGLYYYNSIPNAVVSYPFYYIGSLLISKRSFLVSYKPTLKIFLSLFLISLSLLIICGKYNDPVMIYRNFTGNYALFIIGAISGIVLVYCIALLISKSRDILAVLSIGNIFVLGTHGILLSIIAYFVNLGVLSYLLALVIYLCYIPIIKSLLKSFPVILGRKKID